MIKEENGNITIDVTEVQLIKSMALLQDLIKFLENHIWLFTWSISREKR